MLKHQKQPNQQRTQRGATLPEFALVGLVFLIVVFGIVECSRLLWTQNMLTDAARRGARYAATTASTGTTAVKNMVLYGTTTAGASGTEVVPGITAANVTVNYSAGYDTKNGNVTVVITGYQFTLNIPLIGRTLTMPDFKATMTAESAGRVPTDI